MRALGFDAKKAEVLKILRDYDRDGNNLMDFDSFSKVSKDAGPFCFNPAPISLKEMLLAATVGERILARDPIEEIRKAFALFDDENTGKIGLRNLRRVAKELGENLEDDELQVNNIYAILLLHQTVYSTHNRQ
jgi:centrin-3